MWARTDRLETGDSPALWKGSQTPQRSVLGGLRGLGSTHFPRVSSSRSHRPWSQARGAAPAPPQAPQGKSPGIWGDGTGPGGDEHWAPPSSTRVPTPHARGLGPASPRGERRPLFLGDQASGEGSEVLTGQGDEAPSPQQRHESLQYLVEYSLLRTRALRGTHLWQKRPRFLLSPAWPRMALPTLVLQNTRCGHPACIPLCYVPSIYMGHQHLR